MQEHFFSYLDGFLQYYEMVLISKSCLGQIPIVPKFSFGPSKKNVEGRKKSKIQTHYAGPVSNNSEYYY